jgi:Pyridoxamine 5'-phosphate oxidase
VAAEDEALPDWPPGTVALLATLGDGAPHAIPVSTALRAGPRRIVLALARSRSSLGNLRADPRCAVALLAGGDVAFTARGRARVLREALPGAEAVAAVLVDVEEVRSHDDPRFTVEDGVRWAWTDREAEDRDAEVRAALAILAEEIGAPPPGDDG